MLHENSCRRYAPFLKERQIYISGSAIPLHMRLQGRSTCSCLYTARVSKSLHIFQENIYRPALKLDFHTLGICRKLRTYSTKKLVDASQAHAVKSLSFVQKTDSRDQLQALATLHKPSQTPYPHVWVCDGLASVWLQHNILSRPINSM